MEEKVSLTGAYEQLTREILEEYGILKTELIASRKQEIRSTKAYVTLLEGVSDIIEELLKDKFWYLPGKWWKTKMANVLVEVARKAMLEYKE